MLTRLQIQNYRGFKDLDVHLQPFQVLIGPNGSGKSTFFDSILFLRDMLTNGIVEAIHQRADYYEQLTFGQNSEPIKLALEAEIPERFQTYGFEQIRYEVGIKSFLEENKYDYYFEHIQFIKKSQPNSVLNEPSSARVYNKTKILNAFPDNAESIAKSVFKVDRSKGGDDKIWINQDLSEYQEPELKHIINPFLEDLFLSIPGYWVEEYPAINWYRKLLATLNGVFELESKSLRKPQRPGEGDKFKNNGANFPFVFESFQKDEKTYQEWLGHVQTALPSIKQMNVQQYPEDRRKYLVIVYQNGEKIPSWLASDGTLKFIFLTMLAYSNLSIKGHEVAVNMIEEVENGLHPQAIEALMDSLSSVWDSNVMVTTHSPVVLNYKDMKPEDLLIFHYSEKEGIQVQNGKDHPGLNEWKRNDITFSEMLQAGIL